jgi:ABC-type lipoprotein export system ATPase subunit
MNGDRASGVGTSWNLNDLAGNLLQPLCNRITMRRLDGDDFQEEEIQEIRRSSVGFP